MDLSEFSLSAEGLRVLGIIVSRDGEQIVRQMYEAPIRRNLYSASKSFTSAAVGIAVQEGLLSLDERIVDVFREELPERVSDNLEKAKVRDLLTMCLGHDRGWLMGEDRPYYRDRDWARLALAQPFPYEPGSRFVYDNSGPYLAGLLVQRRAGTDLVRYLMPRLFEPMGIYLPTWETDPYGNTFGAGGLFLTIDELHRFGELYLAKGNWNGRQLISEAWVDVSTAKQAENGGDGYGYLFWRGEHNSYRADGKYGQFTIIFEEKNAVVTLTAESRAAGDILRAVYDVVYPQL